MDKISKPHLDKASAAANLAVVDTWIAEVSDKINFEIERLKRMVDENGGSSADVENGIGAVKSLIGSMTKLETQDQKTIVSAINEVKGNVDDVSGSVGDLSKLYTYEKSSAVDSINEVVLWCDRTFNEMKQSFQDGVDSVYDAVIAMGSTPESKNLPDVVTAISKIDTPGSYDITVSCSTNRNGWNTNDEYQRGRYSAYMSLKISIRNDEVERTSVESGYIKDNNTYYLDNAGSSASASITKV